MDKNSMSNDKKTDPQVHRLPAGGLREIHKQYGLWIFRGGNGTSVPDSYMKLPQKRYFEFYSISHMYQGEGRLWLEDGREYAVHPGDCVIMTPGTLNWYGGIGGERYCEDFLNFCGPVADMLVRAGVISCGVFPFGHIRRLPVILEHASDPAVSSQIRANIELQKLLVEIYLQRDSRAQTGYPLLDDLLKEIRENPERWWSVQEMAELCNLSVDQLRRVFFQRTGINPKTYVDRLKINHAAEFLINFDMPVAQVAEHFGYQDPYHFARRFKAILGISPGQYRNSVAVARDKSILPQAGPLQRSRGKTG